MRGDASNPPTFSDSFLFYLISFTLIAVFVSTLAWCIYLVLRHYAFPAIRRWYERPVLSKTQTVVSVDYGHMAASGIDRNGKIYIDLFDYELRDHFPSIGWSENSGDIIQADRVYEEAKKWWIPPQAHIRVVPMFYDWAEIPEWGLCDA